MRLTEFIDWLGQFPAEALVVVSDLANGSRPPGFALLSPEAWRALVADAASRKIRLALRPIEQSPIDRELAGHWKMLASAITPKPATHGRLKTGHFGRAGQVEVIYCAAAGLGKFAA